MVEIIFLMLVLKLPILYLIGVVWWAVRAEPPPPEPAVLPVVNDDAPAAPFRRTRPRRPLRGGPHERGAQRRGAKVPIR
ncbi:MAG TPA: hypothetical protein VGU26_03370 [Gaiellaceae bacterium]|nr:hypothetical protein [Gaiellaceae bacterium]